MKYFALWLEGPMQSWGFDSSFFRRDTLAFPTRSGVVGMLFAAAGLSGEQKELLAQMADCPQEVIAYHLPRADAHRLMDFHTVGNGYDDSDPWEKMHILKKTDGGKANKGGSKLTYRYYLMDVKFGVVMACPDQFVNIFEEGIKDPIYDTYLGRKCCIPTEFVYQGTFPTSEEALNQVSRLAGSKGLLRIFSVSETPIDDAETLVLSDVPLQWGLRKKYKARTVYILNDDQ